MKVIAHRGASAYLPEHTLAAKALAHGMGCDFLEQDVVATRDHQLLVLHDIHIDRVTDVASVFPGRARDDGRFYAIDFDLDELLTLTVFERFDDAGEAVFPGRFPRKAGLFRLNTLDEELRFIQGLNRSTGRDVGIYTEIKKPAWHREQGVDLSVLVIEALARHHYTERDSNAYLQCFDADEVVRIRSELGSRLRLVQLIADNDWGESATDYDALASEAGIRAMADNVDGFGPWINQLYRVGPDGKPESTGLAERIHEAGKVCHPYTVRADSLPEGFGSLAALVEFLSVELAVDAVFSDNPDLHLLA